MQPPQQCRSQIPSLSVLRCRAIDRRRDRDGYLLANGQGVRLPAAADPLGRADYLAVAQVGGAGKDGRNQSIFLAAALPVSAFEKELAHLVRRSCRLLPDMLTDSAVACLRLLQYHLDGNTASEHAPLTGVKLEQKPASGPATPRPLPSVRVYPSAWPCVQVRDEEAVFWAAGRQAVTGRRRRAVGAVVLSEAPLEVSDAQALPVLLEVRHSECLLCFLRGL